MIIDDGGARDATLEAPLDSRLTDLDPTPTENLPLDNGVTTHVADLELDGVERDQVPRHARPQRDFWKAMGDKPIRAVLFGLLLAGLFGALGAVASMGSGGTTYTSSTVMIIDDPYGLATNGSADEFVKLDALRVKYSGLVSTYAIDLPVANRLHLPVGAVLGAVSTDVPFESLLMTVSATWPTPREAQVLSQAVANEVTNYVESENATYGIPASDQFTFKTIDPATPAIAQRASKSKALTLGVGLAILGFLLGFFATQVARFLR